MDTHDASILTGRADWVDRDCGAKLEAASMVPAELACVFNTTRTLSRTPKHGGLYRYGTEACDRVGPRL